ncbi:hypothetical protein TREPR_2055 [Treponema primitia ZAS-2]|uniref:Uncharacterized protein n=1 Tax=Treponema primitia (strain ATCC BAA-887 / DSM 12427 / ZAS-2) TaxID=545694 RepID=F5YJT1_TREPZ|nr:hypothetical protein TREPR_2055 [Treponema primitia ZAS-2]
MVICRGLVFGRPEGAVIGARHGIPVGVAVLYGGSRQSLFGG